MTSMLLKNCPENRKDYFNCSVSKIKTFKSCRAKYYYAYIEKLPKVEQDFQILGKFLHQVLENFQNARIKGDESKDNLLMKVSYKDALAEYSNKLTKEQKEISHKICANYLKNMHNLRLVGKLPKPIAAEKEFYIIINDEILLNGFIDILQEDYDGVVLVSDYKTSKNSEYLKKDFFQLKTYAWAMFLENQQLEKIKTSYIMLKYEIEPKVLEYVLTKEFKREKVVESVEKYFIDAYEEIKEEKLFRPEVSPLCAFCDYVESCKEGKKFKEIYELKKGKQKISFGAQSW